MLVVILIRRILQKPLFLIQRQRNQAQILPRRMIDTSRVAFVLTTQQTFRIRSTFCLTCGDDRFRIFFRLGQIDGDVQFTISARMFPAVIFRNARHADVVARARLLVKILRRRLWAGLVLMRKFSLNYRWRRHKTPHDRCIEQIALRNTIVRNHATRKRIGYQNIQHRLNMTQSKRLRIALIRPCVQLQHRHQAVAHLVFIRRNIQFLLAPIAHQRMQRAVYLHLRHDH